MRAAEKELDEVFSGTDYDYRLTFNGIKLVTKADDQSDVPAEL